MPVQEKARDKIYPKGTKETNSTSYHLLISFMMVNCSRAHNAILSDRGQSPKVGILKMSHPKVPSLQNNRLLLLSIITILSKDFSNVPWVWGWMDYGNTCIA